MTTHLSASVQQFPALAKLAWRPRRDRRIPYVQQLESADCAAACLAMVLGMFGYEASLEEAAQAVGVSGQGATASAILEGATRFGLRGRGVQLDIGELEYLKPGAILHWKFQHFVVFDGLGKRGVQVVDPAAGRRTISMSEFRRAFTGVALVFERGDEFMLRRRDKRGAAAYLAQLFGQRKLLGRLAWTSVLLRGLGLALPAFTGVIVDRVVPRADLDLLLVLCVGLGTILVFQTLSAVVRGHLMLQLRTNLDTRLTLGLVDHLVSLPLDFYRRRSAGDLLARINSNAQIRETLSSTALQSLLDAFFVVLYLAALFVVDFAVGLITFTLVAVFTLAYVTIRRRWRDLQTESLEVRAASQNYLVQMLAGVEALKLAGAEQRAVQRWSNLFVDELNTELRSGRLKLVYKALLDVLSAGGPIIVLSYGALVVVDGSMSLGTLVAVSALVTGALGPVRTVLDTVLSIDKTGAAIERVEDVLDQPREQDPSTAAPVHQLGGHIRLDNVSFGYNRHQAPTLVNVSLEVAPGSMVAVVGRSGSGKSTLASLMAGLYSPNEGTIRFDGRDLTQLDLRDLRRRIGVITQDTYLFGASIRENIALSDPAVDLARVAQAAKIAGIHDEIIALPMGYDTVLADGGASISGGQRQRIALARCLVQRPRILLLDEATSALDTVKEAEVMANIERIRATRIVIAHRLSTVASADLIVVMDQGQIVEYGSHRHLMAHGALYRELVAAQSFGPADFEAVAP